MIGCRGSLEREVEDGEQAGAVPLDGKPLLLNPDAPDEELPVNRLDEVAMGDGFPSRGALRWRDRQELCPGDELALGVRKGAVHGLCPPFRVGRSGSKIPVSRLLGASSPPLCRGIARAASITWLTQVVMVAPVSLATW